MKKLTLTENESGVLIESSYKHDLSEDELQIFDKVDEGGTVTLAPKEVKVVRKVARAIEPFELKKYKVSKIALLRKLK